MIVKEVTNLLRTASLNGVDNVYPFFIPEDKQSSTETTDILVTEIYDVPDSYGSDDIYSTEQAVQLNIFYGLHSKTVADTLEKSIVSFLMQKNWRLFEKEGHNLDPDTRQLTQIMKFRKRNLWN